MDSGCNLIKQLVIDLSSLFDGCDEVRAHGVGLFDAQNATLLDLCLDPLDFLRQPHSFLLLLCHEAVLWKDVRQLVLPLGLARIRCQALLSGDLVDHLPAMGVQVGWKQQRLLSLHSFVVLQNALQHLSQQVPLVEFQLYEFCEHVLRQLDARDSDVFAASLRVLLLFLFSLLSSQLDSDSGVHASEHFLLLKEVFELGEVPSNDRPVVHHTDLVSVAIFKLLIGHLINNYKSC